MLIAQHPSMNFPDDSFMRTTINLEQNAYDYALLYAREKGFSRSKAVSELIRIGYVSQVKQQANSTTSSLVRGPCGIMTFAPSGRIITDEMVRADLDEDD